MKKVRPFAMTMVMVMLLTILSSCSSVTATFAVFAKGTDIRCLRAFLLKINQKLTNFVVAQK